MSLLLNFHSMTYVGNGVFSLVVTNGDEFFEGRCEINSVLTQSFPPMNLVSFQPESFRKLCTLGMIDTKFIGNLVFSVYENINLEMKVQ